MSILVIYKSKYGSTQTYAQWIAEELNADILKANQVKPNDLKKYDTIIYGGGLYGGSVNGISLLSKNYEIIKDKELYLFTVGTADCTVLEIREATRTHLELKILPDLWEKLHVYHLRGAMKISNLSLIHRMMIGMKIKMLRKNLEKQRTKEEEEMLAVISKDTDFIDRNSIDLLVNDIKAVEVFNK